MTLPVDPETTTPIGVAELLTAEKIGPRDGAGKLAVVAMSGGVDSAVAALLMRERGYRVVGMNLRLFSPDDPEHQVNPCCGIAALDDARATCALLGIPFYAIDMEAEFGEAVVDRFVGEYAAGRTPNPCLECNRHVKFRHLVRRARLLGAHCLATGHYARIVHGIDGEPHRLYRAIDPKKDQSYVLYTMDQAQLGYVRFPLGNLTKLETRRLAKSFGLPVAEKAESQEICFVGGAGKGAYASFVAARRPDVVRPGEIVDTSGAPVGQHRGLVHHTVGQRRGLGVAAGAPLYVVGLEPAANRVVVGSRAEAAAREIDADAVSLTGGVWPAEPFLVEAVVRYRSAPHPAEVRLGPAGSGEATIAFQDEGPIAAPGQAVVFYRGDEVLGGGTIRAVRRAGRSTEATEIVARKRERGVAVGAARS